MGYNYFCDRVLWILIWNIVAKTTTTWDVRWIMDWLSWTLGIVFGILAIVALCRKRHPRCGCGTNCGCDEHHGCGERHGECHAHMGRLSDDRDEDRAACGGDSQRGDSQQPEYAEPTAENCSLITVLGDASGDRGNDGEGTKYSDAISAVDAVTASDMVGKLYCTNRSCHVVSRHADTRPNPIQERRAKRLHLLGDIDPNEVDPDGWELLQIAAYRGDTAAIDELTEEFTTDREQLSQMLEVALDDGMTPLCLAIENGYASAALRLLELGAGATVVTADGWTPLHLASAAGMHRVATALYDAGADPKAQTESGLTPLHLAVMTGDDAMVRLLCDMAPDGMNMAEHDRLVTPLHLAVENRHLEVVKTLISDGADLHARNADSLTPLAIAAAKNYTEIETVLKAYAA